VGKVNALVVLVVPCSTLNGGAWRAQEYEEKMYKGAPWWPGWKVTDAQREKIRRAERDVLLAVYVAVKSNDGSVQARGWSAKTIPR